MNSKQPKLRRCRTVGALIAELQKLPKSARLEASIRPVYCNTGEIAKSYGMEPCVILDEYE